jgi:hypothetical protein
MALSQQVFRLPEFYFAPGSKLERCAGPGVPAFFSPHNVRVKTAEPRNNHFIPAPERFPHCRENGLHRVAGFLGSAEYPVKGFYEILFVHIFFSSLSIAGAGKKPEASIIVRR